MSFNDLIKYQYCQQFLEKCPFATEPQGCVNNFCYGEPYGFGSCTTDFTGKPALCCQQADAASCLATFQKGLGGGTPDACSTIQAEAAYCNSAVTGFASLSASAQAHCLCYDQKGNYAPNYWDDAAASCYSSGSAAHPKIWALLTANSGQALGFCTKFAGPASSAAKTTAPVNSASTTPMVTSSNAPAASSSSGPSSAQPTSSDAPVVSSSQATITPATTPSQAATTPAATTKTSRAAKASVDMKLVALGLGLLLPSLLAAIM